MISSIGVFNTALWCIFTHISFMKCRQKDFVIFLALGMTHHELKLLLLLENILIFLIYMPIGLILGIMFSKIIALSIFKLVGISHVTFHFKSIVYIITIGYYTILTIIFILWTFKFINSLPVLDEPNHKILNRLYARNKYILKVSIISLILCCIYLNEMLGLPTRIRYYVNYSFISIIGTYLLFLTLIKTLSIFIKSNKNFYYKRIFLINEVETFFRSNKIIIFFIAFLNFIFCICKRIYYLPDSRIYYAHVIFQNSVFNLIYTFIVLLSFIASAVIMYFKMKIDFYSWKFKKNNLYDIGLIDEEINALLICKLKLIFFSHVILIALASIIYIFLLKLSREFIISTIKILSYYFIIQLLGYIIAKDKLIEISYTSHASSAAVKNLKF
ncbi:FtsX-like permease family protein [Clostridium sp. WILCCON 0269]|uniref:FtsX-like permease family protein n=1 Tax=Candidatus Clostridium eludens TaxID=3381663 RepID=A0ABW8SNJ4_9CLOT